MATDEDALAAALAQFNEGLEAQEAERAAQRAIDKAERKKQQAAAALKNLEGDPDASAEDKAAANDEYRKAVEEFNQLRSGEPIESADETAAEEDPSSEPAVDDGEPEAGESDTTDSDAAANGDEATPAVEEASAGEEDAGENDAGEPAEDEPATEGADESESDG